MKNVGVMAACSVSGEMEQLIKLTLKCACIGRGKAVPRERLYYKTIIRLRKYIL